MNKKLIFIGILFSSILIIENIIVSNQAYIIIWNTKSYFLSIFSIFIGFILGFGVKGLFLEKDSKIENEDF